MSAKECDGIMAMERHLADMGVQARILRKHGHVEQAASIEHVLDGVRRAAPEYFAVLSETEAVA
jgi:hypothetical protein